MDRVAKGKGKGKVNSDVSMVDDPPNDIMDIIETPDVAVWSKGIRKGTNVPSDRVREPSKIRTSFLRIKGQDESAIDPANEQEVEEAFAVADGSSLTDESEMSESSVKKKDTLD